MPRPGDNATPSEVRHLLKHSSKFYLQSWQKYRVKETHKGPEVWKVRHLTVWRQTSEHLPSTRCTLITAKNIRTGELKFFLVNGLIGVDGITVRGLLTVTAQAIKFHTKTRIKLYLAIGIDVEEIKSCYHIL